MYNFSVVLLVKYDTIERRKAVPLLSYTSVLFFFFFLCVFPRRWVLQANDIGWRGLGSLLEKKGISRRLLCYSYDMIIDAFHYYYYS